MCYHVPDSMPLLAIHASRALTPLEEIQNAVVLIEDQTIRAVGPKDSVSVPRNARRYQAEGMTIVPGFVDVHIHGAGGHDVMEGDVAALRSVAAAVARSGTTSLLPTTVTAAPDETCHSLERIASFIKGQTLNGLPAAEFLGIHLEGPFISVQRRGVHPQQWIAHPSTDLLQRFVSASGAMARILTLAPELHGALDLIGAATGQGLIVAMGHTDATYDQTREAIARGARHAAHVFNAMRPFTHRETGVLGAVLTAPEVTAELIADGVHVDSAAIRILLAAKGHENVLLVSDGTAATGMPDGVYDLGPIQVTVAGGVCRSSEGRLAGSTLTLDRALRHTTSLGVPLRHALRMLTLNPARLLGLEKRKGVIAPGADADLVLLDGDLRIAGVLTRGIGL